LVDKNELTSGSTWLAAGNVPQYARTYNGTKIHNYPVELYPTLEEETGQYTGWHTCGSLRIAMDPERMLEYKHIQQKDLTLGINSRLVEPDEMREIYPLINTEGVLGGLFHPDDGHVDPAGVTQAMAKGAKQRGAEIYRFNPVAGITRTISGEWIVHTKEGAITCEYIVNCAGLWAPKIGAMVGLDLPIIPIEHQHILFDDMPELKDTGLQLPLLRDPDTSYYMRQEMAALLIGPYETEPAAWHPEGVPDDFAAASLPPNLDRINDILMAAIARVPALESVGIRHETNGPITYTPDGAPLVGPAFGVPNFFINAGHCFGITECAAYGLYTAEWIVEGEAGIDLCFSVPRRYGAYANKKYLHEKAMETYRMMYAIEFSGEVRDAARPVKTSPIHDLLDRQGASFAPTYGWERPNWFAAEGEDRKEVKTFKRSNWHEPVARECRAVREKAAVLDLSGFSKFEVHGPGAETCLNYLCANSLPREIGRMRVTHMLDHRGRFKCDMTITKIDHNRYYVVSAASAERPDLDWMQKHMPRDGSVAIDNVTTMYGALILSGPKSRDVLSRVTDADLSNEGFPFLTMQDIIVGLSPTRAFRIGFVGELGWEFHCPVENVRSIYQALMEAGAEFGIANYGLRALNSLRLEKGYLLLGTEISSERTPLEAGLDRFVDFEKGDFIGRQALLDQRKSGLADKLTLMVVDADDADAMGDEPVSMGDEIVGRVTSGGYGHHLGKSLAMGYLKTEAAKPGTRVEIAVLGERRPAETVRIPLYDPRNEKPRS
jgi:dimethylglycine dehydrogenase